MSPALRDEIRRLVRLAAPLVLAQLAQMGMSFIDTLMAGRLGGGALAGIALGGTVYGFVQIASMGVLFSVGPMTSQAHGAGDIEGAARGARQGMWLALLLSIPGVLLFRNIEGPLLLMGQQPDTAALAAGYLGAVAWGFLPALLLVALRGFLEGLGDTRPIMLIMLLGVGANVLLNNALMFGRWGFPALGLVGTGVATTVVYSLMFVLVALTVMLRHRRFRVFRTLRRPDPTVLRELIVVGVPIGLTLAFEAALFAVAALLMGLIGRAELAGHQIAIQSASITFMIPVGLSIATSVRVGQAVGRNDPAGVRRAGYVGMGLSALVMILTALLFWLAPMFVVGLFLDTSAPANSEVVRYARAFLGFAAMFQVFDGLQVSASGALRGFKDTRVPMVLSLVSYWLVGMSSGVALAFWGGMQGSGLWLGLVLGLGCAALLLALRFRSRVRRVPSRRVPTSPLP